MAGCSIPAAPVDGVVAAPVEDEVPDLAVPAEVVLVPVADPVAVVAVLMLAVVRVVFLADETTTTEDNDGGGTLVLAEGMTVATAG